MSSLENIITSSKFSVVKNLVDLANTGDWERFMGAFPENFVYEFIVFDGPNICFTKRRVKEHFESIPGFKLGQYKLIHVIEGEDKILLHLTTTTQFMIASPPGELLYELFFVAHVQGGQVTRLQMCTDSKTVAEITLKADAV